MKLKRKIIISFAIIACMPLVVFWFVYMITTHIQIKNMEKEYGIEISSYNMLYNQIEILNEINNKAYKELKDIRDKDFEKLKSTNELDKLNNKLKNGYTYLYAAKDGRGYYNGNQKAFNEIETYLKSESKKLAEFDNPVYFSGEIHYLVNNVSFGDKDSLYRIFIISEVEGSFPEIKQTIIKDIIFSVIIVIIAVIFLAIWIYRGVLRPVNDLKIAVDSIKQGNLDFEIEQYSEDNEFAQLSQAVEEMKIRLKESIQENIKNDEESRELISNISHDLKTPLTTIKGYVEGIMDGVAVTPEKMQKYLKTVYNKANDMDRLIGELTMLSKFDSNRVIYNFVKLNIKDYFDDCVGEIKSELDSKNIELTYINYTTKSTQVIADPEQLKRVINNIVANSIKYMDKEYKFIAIRIFDEKENVRVEIEDNGKGIGVNEIPFIFDRFYRTDSSRNSTQGGSGIGLSITKKIIEAHGGKVWASSKLGSGTSIQFILRKVI